MPVYQLPEDEIVLPDPSLAEPDGLLAIGDDLSPERLILAYANGIFPWPHEGMPLLWFSPDPRWVLPPAELHLPRRLRRILRQGRFELSLDRAFGRVIRACAAMERGDEVGTWITSEMIAAYERLHDLGLAHSAEACLDGDLVGGLYGVSIGRVFTAESMFTAESDAPKAALAALVRQLERWDFDLFDVQVRTEHVLRYGVRPWNRERYLEVLRSSGLPASRRGPWILDEDLRGGVPNSAY